MASVETFDDLADRIAASTSSGVRLVAIDGLGGSGKTTFAGRLVRALGGAPLVSTDDFASWDEPLDWWPRLHAQVIEPLARGVPGRYQRYDWAARRLSDWRYVPPAPVVVVEGVSASRQEWAQLLAVAVWVEAPRDVRVHRGLERDGAAAFPLWEKWMADEDRYVERDSPITRADLVVDGAPSLSHDPDREYVRVV